MIRARASFAAFFVPLVVTASSFAEEHGGEQPSLFTGDLGNIIWSLATFLVVLLVLGKFAWKPILAALQKREDFIRDSLAQARCDREEAERKLKEYTDKIVAAQAEARAIVQEGRRDAEEVKHKIEEEAHKEADAMVARARREVQLATETAVKELYSLAGKLATGVAARLIRKELTPQDQRRLAEEAVEEFRSAEASGREGLN